MNDSQDAEKIEQQLLQAMQEERMLASHLEHARRQDLHGLERLRHMRRNIAALESALTLQGAESPRHSTAALGCDSPATMVTRAESLAS